METHAVVNVQEKNVDVDGNTTFINQSAKLSPDGRVFSPLSEIPDSKPDGFKEYICNFGSKSMILGLPDTSDKSNTKRPYYQYVTYFNKETPHTLQIKEDENEFALVLEEYSNTDELISKFILYYVLGDFYEGEYYNFIANKKWNIRFASREY